MTSVSTPTVRKAVRDIFSQEELDGYRHSQGALRVLFIESGVTGGGSFESMFQHLSAIETSWIWPTIVYLNETAYVDKVQSLGFPIKVIKDYLYSQHSNHIVRKILQAIVTRLELYIPQLYLPFLRIVQAPTIMKLVKLINKERFDLIYLNVQVNRDFFGLIASNATNTICISHLRSLQRTGKFDKYRAKFANKTASAFIANLPLTYDHWKEKGLFEDKMWLVHNGISLDGPEPFQLKKRWPQLLDFDLIIGCVARLDPIKGHDFLLKAFKTVISDFPRAALLIVGDGPLSHNLKKQSQALGLQSNVVFAGHQSDPKNILASVDVSVCMSDSDSFGRVVLETMLAKTPLIATDTGSIRDIVVHEENALLIPYGDTGEFANAVKRIVSTKALAFKLTANAFKTISQNFSIASYANYMEYVFRSAL